MHGWKGKVIFVDLTAGKSWIESTAEEWRNHYLGGRGLGTYLLYKMTQADTDPDSADNPLIVTTGPLTGTLTPTCGRYSVSAISPLTGILGDGNAAGFFAPELKYAGFDALILMGRSPKPVYIWIENEHIAIRPAASVWGMDTWDTVELLRKDTHPQAEIACIGPAGENGIPFATIMNNSKRAVGRSGMGAVMGGKNVKALAVRGTGGVMLADPKGHMLVMRDLINTIYKSSGYPLRSRFGTTVITDVYHRAGTLPIHNSQFAWDPRTEEISAGKIQSYTQGLRSCFACPIHCSRYTKVAEQADGRANQGEGPEFETIAALGPRCGNFHLPAILRMNHMANRLGLDTISLGGVLSFAMECRQRGLIDKGALDGLNLTWGAVAEMEAAIEKIAYQKGCGIWLSKGVRALAREIPGSEPFAIHVKGLEAPEQEPRGMKAWGLGWAVSSRGADHLRAFPLAETTWTAQEAETMFGDARVADPLSYEGKANLVKWSEEVSAICDSLVVCKFFLMAMAVPLSMICAALYTACGTVWSEEDLLACGERMVNLERMFNVRRGLDRRHDRLPERFSEPLNGGPRQGEKFILENMLDEYYRIRGWDATTGIPEQSTLKRLNLGWICDKS